MILFIRCNCYNVPMTKVILTCFDLQLVENKVSLPMCKVSMKHVYKTVKKNQLLNMKFLTYNKF